MTTRISPYLAAYAPNTVTPDDWRSRAACRPELGVDPIIFYPGNVENSWNRTLTAEAKAVCHNCPVITQCLTWAMNNDEHGIAGGMTPKERTAVKRQATRKARPSTADPTRTNSVREHGTVKGYDQHRRQQERSCQPCLTAVREERAEQRAERDQQGVISAVEAVRQLTAHDEGQESA